MTNDELRALADRLDVGEFMGWLVEHPEVVESLLLGTDWACVSGGVRDLLQRLRHCQQEVLAAGGGRLTVVDGDATYVATL